MVNEVTMFWLIHLFLGVIVPLMIYFNCCGMRDSLNADQSNQNEFFLR